MSIPSMSPLKLGVNLYQSEQTSTHLLPQLWLDSLDICPRHSKDFRLCSIDDEPQPGFPDIIALKTERDIRRKARQLQAVGAQKIQIFPSDLLAFSIATDLLSKSTPLDTWLALMKEESLSQEEAKAIAVDILALPKSSEGMIELELLRQRTGMKEYDWNQFIKQLEAEIHAAVDSKVSRSDRLKLDISAWLRVTDPFQQVEEKIRILTHYNLKEKDFERLWRALKDAEKQSANKPRLLSLKEAFSLESHALKWTVPGYLPAKSSALLSGLPGSGKTLLSIDLAHAVATGGKFLGEQCAKGKVLMLNTDQPLNITMSYLYDRGFDQEENLVVVGQTNDLPAWTIRDLELLESWLDEVKPELTVIDSVRTTICYPLGLEEKSEQVGHWMKEVERLVTRYGSLLWVHHNNKDKELKGVSRASGSTAIPGNVSVHWSIEASSSDPSDLNRRLSMPKTRGFESSTVNIQYKPETGEWNYLGRVGESQETAAKQQSIQEQILEFLRERPGVGFEGSEFKAMFGDSVYSILSRMVSRGLVSKRRSKSNSKSKIYFLPNQTEELSHRQTESTPPPPRFFQGGVCLDSESLTTKESCSPNTHQTTHQTLTKHPAHQTPLFDSQDTDTVKPESSPNTPSQSEGGGGVTLKESVTVSANTQPVTPVTPHSPADSGELQKGDRVQYTGTHKSYKKYQGKVMVVTRVDSSFVSCRLIDSDKELADKFQTWNLNRLSR